MGGSPKFTLALAVALACTITLTACGGSGDDSTQSASVGSDSTSAAPALTPGGPVHGRASPQSAPFQKYSGKGTLGLAEFGEEASGSDFREAQEVIVDYLRASGGEEWGKACAYLVSTVKAQLQQIAAASKGISFSSCGAALKQFAKSSLWTQASDGSPINPSKGISSLRTKEGGLARGGAGFALFHGSDGEDHWVAMKVEGGSWKVLSTSPQPFQ